MGCIPSILAQSSSGACSDEVNRLIVPFNANVKTMINDLSSNLPGAKFTYIDVARMFEDVITNARSYGKYFIKQIVLSRYY
jgi:phospholipase/lecithinase/hemolysin